MISKNIRFIIKERKLSYKPILILLKVKKKKIHIFQVSPKQNLGFTVMANTHSSRGWKAKLSFTAKCVFRLSTMSFWWKTSMLNDWLLLTTSFKNVAEERKRHKMRTWELFLNNVDVFIPSMQLIKHKN